MPTDGKKLFNKKMITGAVCYAVFLLVLNVIAYYTELSAFLNTVIGLFRPILIGLVLAYLFNPIFCFFEVKILFRLRPAALRRALSLLLTYVLVIVIIALILVLILPQLTQSLISFVTNYETHVNDAIAYINELFDKINGVLGTIFGQEEIFRHINSSQFLNTIFKILNDTVSQINVSGLTTTASSVFGWVADIIFAVFISLYLLSSKEKRYAQVMKLRRALFSDMTNKYITKFCTIADDRFGKFLEGKFIDSMIIGVLTYIVTSVFGIPYAILIASITAIANIIPIIGFLAGIIPSALLVFLTDAERLLPFLLIMFIIYQIDVNIISPKILGNNTGISALCVIISICIMGTLWGFVGMLLGVPLFATVLELSDSLVHNRLQKKRLPDDVENYYAPDPIVDPMRSTSNGSGRLIKALEKRVLHAQAMIENGHELELTRRDRVAMRLYALARKTRIIKETPPEILVQFAAERAERALTREHAYTCEQLARNVYIPDDIPPVNDGDEKGV